MIVGHVETFPNAEASKAQALKVLEEAAEVFGAWQMYDGFYDGSASYEWTERDLIDECADVIQATCNLLSALGVQDLSEAMERCKERNEKRGRL